MGEEVNAAAPLESIRPVNLLFGQCGMSCCFQLKHHLVQKYISTNLLGKLAEFGLLKKKCIRIHRCTYVERMLEGDTPAHTVMLYMAC